MNAVEIEEAIAHLAEQLFDAQAFPFAFLEAFGNKKTTIKRLKTGSSNASDIEGGVLQRSNIHIAVCGEGDVTSTNAGVTVSVIGYGKPKSNKRLLFSGGVKHEVSNISPYLTSGDTKIINALSNPISSLNNMSFGSMPNDGGGNRASHKQGAHREK